MRSYAKNSLPLPRHELPVPIFDAEPGFEDLYWETWQFPNPQSTMSLK